MASDVPVTGRRVVYVLAAVVTALTWWQLAPLWFGLGWVVAAYRWPLAPCWKCHGSKTNTGSGRRRFGSCKRCKGSGVRWVIGSRALHRAVVELRKQRKARNGQ